jgi:hypothetical protein
VPTARLACRLATAETLLEEKAFAGFASAAITHVVETARSADR